MKWKKPRNPWIPDKISKQESWAVLSCWLCAFCIAASLLLWVTKDGSTIQYQALQAPQFGRSSWTQWRPFREPVGSVSPVLKLCSFWWGCCCKQTPDRPIVFSFAILCLDSRSLFLSEQLMFIMATLLRYSSFRAREGVSREAQTWVLHSFTPNCSGLHEGFARQI